MSAYVDFFVRHNDDFIPISDFSRNSKIYEIMSGFAPWEKIRPLTAERLTLFVNEAQHGIEQARNGIAKEKEQIQLVSQFNNSAEEKIEYIQDCRESIEEYEYLVQEYEYAKYFFLFLEEMIDAVRWKDDCAVDVEKYIYVGIEIGSPKIEDIEN